MYFIGKLYVAGGEVKGKPTNLAEVIEVANQTGTPTALPPMRMPRSQHALAAGGSRVFAFGGRHSDDFTTSDVFFNAVIGISEPVSSCEFYDSRTNR